MSTSTHPSSPPPSHPSGLRRTTVEQVMTRDVISVTPGTPTEDVLAVLRSHGVRAVPVLDADRHLLGVITQFDLLGAVAHEDPGHGGTPPRRGRRHAEPGTPISDCAMGVMSPHPVTVGPRAAVAEAARLMRSHHLAWMPVMSGQHLVGVITRSDLLRVFDRDDADLAREIRDEVFGRILLIDPHNLEITVHEGVVTLAGTVPTRADARTAHAFTERLEGVLGVEDQLRWITDERGADLSEIRRSDGAEIRRY